MNCYGCKCNHCLYNCELESWYLTPGEVENVEDICYFCDECRGFDGITAREAIIGLSAAASVFRRSTSRKKNLLRSGAGGASAS